MSENTITIKEFVKKYTEFRNDVSKDGYLKKIKIIPYVDYLKKVTAAENIAKRTCKNSNGDICVNSPMRYVLFVFTVLQLYTNLIISSEDRVEDFDLLNKNGLIDKIFELIPENELAEFKTILDLSVDDFMTNHYEAHAFVESQVNRITTVVEKFFEPAVPMFEKLNQKLDSMSEKNIEKLGSKIDKIIRDVK